MLPRAARAFRWLPTAALFVLLLVSTRVSDRDLQVLTLTGPDQFRLLDWESTFVAARLGRILDGLLAGAPAREGDDEVLRQYFAAPAEERQARRMAAEAAMERAVSGALRQAGTARELPLLGPRVFPPVLTALVQPPNVLIVSPRTALRVEQNLLLRTAMSDRDQSRLEASVDSHGVSSLVAPVGGIATYPAMVLVSDDPAMVLSSVAHEWVHHYLIFHPLGRGYWSDQETREINETTADLVGRELGGQIAARLGLQPSRRPPDPESSPARRGFDFRAFMRATRSEVEALLARGEVDAAEAYMEARRVEVNQQGYAIRKINQAYFALYGSYGEGFAASPSNPIPELLRQVRDRSSSLGQFLLSVRGLARVDDLRRLAE